MALVNKAAQDRGTEGGYAPGTLFTQDEESTASPSLAPPLPSPLITTFFGGAMNTMPSHSPPLALNHHRDNGRTPPHPTAATTTATAATVLLPLPDPQTDTSFIEILWRPNPQLPPGAIMDSPRQPFPGRPSSGLARVTSPPPHAGEGRPCRTIPVPCGSSASGTGNHRARFPSSSISLR